MATETGGRWSNEAVEFIGVLACAKAQELLSCMPSWRGSAWWNLQTVAPRGAAQVASHPFDELFGQDPRKFLGCCLSGKTAIVVTGMEYVREVLLRCGVAFPLRP